MGGSDKKILCVGSCVLDIIHFLDEYPKEDTDTRSNERVWQRGGNAANNCTVLSLLDEKCEYMGALSSIPMFRYVIDDFKKYNIDIKNCGDRPNVEAPLSCIVVSRTTGSRTIVHSNPSELSQTFDEFKKCDLNEYKWIHFGARMPAETIRMIEYVDEYNKSHLHEAEKIILSLDLEKPKEEFLVLARAKLDYIFVGKDYSTMLGAHDKKSAVYLLRETIRTSATIICPWGADGVAVLNSEDKYFSCPSYPPEKIVDTLGAGDTFCAAVMYAISRNNSLETAMEFASRIAGAKCGHLGYDDIRKFSTEMKQKFLQYV